MAPCHAQGPGITYSGHLYYRLRQLAVPGELLERLKRYQAGGAEGSSAAQNPTHTAEVGCI